MNKDLDFFFKYNKFAKKKMGEKFTLDKHEKFLFQSTRLPEQKL